MRAENEALQKQLADVEVAMQQQRALASEAELLRDLLKLQKTTPLPTLAAEVIAGNPIPGMQTVTIGRGTSDGVQANIARLDIAARERVGESGGKARRAGDGARAFGGGDG